MLVQKQHVKFEDGQVYLMPATFVLAWLGPAIGAITIAFNQDNHVFQTQNIIFMLFCAPWLLFLAFGRVHFVSPKAFGGWEKILVHVIACTVAVLVVQIIIAFLSGPTTFIIQPIWAYLFYINAALSEEWLFRVFLVNMIVTLVLAIPVHKRWFATRRVLALVSAVVFSGIAFSLAHLGVYGQVPLMLLSTLIGGTIMAAFLVVTRNPLVPIAAHVANNMIAAGVIITNCVLAGVLA